MPDEIKTDKPKTPQEAPRVDVAKLPSVVDVVWLKTLEGHPIQFAGIPKIEQGKRARISREEAGRAIASSLARRLTKEEEAAKLKAEKDRAEAKLKPRKET